MKFNISYPQTGTQKCVEIDDDRRCSTLYDRRMGQEFEGENLGQEYTGYVFKITGGNDKQGFPMRQGIMVKGRVRILMADGQKTFRIRRDGHRKRKSVRGCILGQDLKVVSLQIVKKGDEEIPGLTDAQAPQRLGPKRVNKIRKLFAIKKTEDKANVLTKKAAIRRTFTSATGKSRQKAPRVQRLVTPERLRRKRLYKLQKTQNWKNGLQQAENYHKLVSEYKLKQLNAKKQARKESQERKESQASQEAPKTTQKKVEPVKPAAKTTPKTQATTTQAKGATTQAKVATKQAPQAATQKQTPATTATSAKQTTQTKKK